MRKQVIAIDIKCGRSATCTSAMALSIDNALGLCGDITGNRTGEAFAVVFRARDNVRNVCSHIKASTRTNASSSPLHPINPTVSAALVLLVFLAALGLLLREPCADIP